MLNSYKTKLIVKQSLTHDICLFCFQLQKPSELHFVAGQYMILMIPQSSANPLRRLYSIASSEKQIDNFELLIKLVDGGVGSEYLTNLQIGDLVDFQGPAGQFGLKENNKNKIFLATGTGIAPMMSMIETVTSKQSAVSAVLLWGVATIKDVFFLDKLKQFKIRRPNFDFKICLSREKDLSIINLNDKQYFSLGRINQALSIQYSKFQIPNSEFYICGRREMVEGLRTQLGQLGVDRERVFFEKF